MTALLLMAGDLANAQTLIPGDHHLRVGEPPLVTLKARLPEAQTAGGLFPQRCVSASLQPVDPREGAAVDLLWHDAERHADGSTWVTFTHPDPLRMDRMVLRAMLHCGPGYTRTQLLQALHRAAEEPTPMSTETLLRPDTRLSASSEPFAPVQPTASLPMPQPGRPTTPHRPNRVPAPPRPDPAPAPVHAPVQAPVNAPVQASEQATVPMPTSAAPVLPASLPSASPLTDAFVQAWQQDLRLLKDELAPLRHQLAAQELRLSAQEDIRRDGLIGLLAVGAGAAGMLMLQRAWREARLRHVERIAPGRTKAIAGIEIEDNASLGGWIGTTHDVEPAERTNAQAPPGRPPEPATLDETRHQALFDAVDALRGTEHLEAAAALLETSLEGEVERPPGLLLRLIDLYRRLAQTELQARAMHELSSLYAVDVPAPVACRLSEELDPPGARRALLGAMPALAGRTEIDMRAQLSNALLNETASQRLAWREFQTALAWHAELAAAGTTERTAARVDQTSTRSMPPALATCT